MESVVLPRRRCPNGEFADDGDVHVLDKSVRLALSAGLAGHSVIHLACLCARICPFTVLAPAAYTLVFANAAPPTVLAPAASAVVLTEATPPTVLALVASAPVLTMRRRHLAQ